MEMFSEIEQEEIIEEFLDIVKMKDYKLKLIDQKTCCNCKDYKKNIKITVFLTNFGCQIILLIIFILTHTNAIIATDTI